MIDWVLRYLVTLQGRIATGVIAMVAAVNFAQPNGPWAFQWEAFAALVGALTAWLIAEIHGSASAYPHDVALFQKIIDTMDGSERHFLRSHDFWFSFSRQNLSGVGEVTYWEGAPFTFLDKQLQKRWLPARKQVDTLRDLVGATTAPDRNASGYQTVHPSDGDREEPNDYTRGEIKALNDASASLARLLDEFETFARRRLRV